MRKLVFSWMEQLRSVPLMLLLVVASYACWLYWPVSWWFSVDRMVVANSQFSKPVPMDIERTIRRPFQGQWQVSVRRWTDRGWEIHCNAAGTSNYLPGSVLPEKLTLSWWTGGVCFNLPIGKYIVDTSWQINGNESRIVNVSSNIFEVTP